MSKTQQRPRSHPVLEGVEKGDTIRFTADGETEIGTVDEAVATKFEDTGFGYTTLPISIGRTIVDIGAEFKPGSGWTQLEATERVYSGKSGTEWQVIGPIEELVVLNPGIDADAVRLGDTLEHLDGTHYRVVELPYERQYDDKFLCYSRETASNACKKIDSSEVVEHIGRGDEL
ncbi:hypothetical protein [Natronosalvus amylolyticus]|uniref:hypothetical protein n=1 Tax=Natronosalvus amylolyticus TaxID=2961994 RepID=UPI0020C9AA10|nr:hypothetical protein [Natronosalvus amylolyticus]